MTTREWLRTKDWTIEQLKNDLMSRTQENDTRQRELGLEKPCKLFQGSLRNGYGHLSRKHHIDGMPIHGVHRMSHTWFNRDGERLPDGLLVCHRCDVRHCVEPTHLFEGTTKVNADDFQAKKRAGVVLVYAVPGRRNELGTNDDTD